MIFELILVSSLLVLAEGQVYGRHAPAGPRVNPFEIFAQLDAIARDVENRITVDAINENNIFNLYDEAILNTNVKFVAENAIDSFIKEQAQQQKLMDKLHQRLLVLKNLKEDVKDLNDEVDAINSVIQDSVYPDRSGFQQEIIALQNDQLRLKSDISEQEAKADSLATRLDESFVLANSQFQTGLSLLTKVENIFEIQNIQDGAILPTTTLNSETSPVTIPFDPVFFSIPRGQQSTITGFYAIPLGDSKHGEGYPQIYAAVDDQITKKDGTYNLVDMSINFEVGLRILSSFGFPFEPPKLH